MEAQAPSWPKQQTRLSGCLQYKLALTCSQQVTWASLAQSPWRLSPLVPKHILLAIRPPGLPYLLQAGRVGSTCTKSMEAQPPGLLHLSTDVLPK
eukprot:822494-Pelagomonas_calceolata.AAC.5